MKVNRSFFFITIIFLALLVSCKDEDRLKSNSATYLRANIDSTSVVFQNSRIRQINNGPYELVGDVLQGEELEKVLSFVFSGLPGNIDSLQILTGTYYEDDYGETWSNFGGPIALSFIGLIGNDDFLSGQISDFTAVNGSDTITITDIEFNRVPIR